MHPQNAVGRFGDISFLYFRIHRTMKLSFLLMGLLAGWLAGCRTEASVDELYASLKPGQARVQIQLDGANFYPAESQFSGQVDVYDTYMRLNLFDQFDSNIIVAFSGSDWYKEKPIRRQVFLDNQVAGSVMIGRLIDKANRRGEGYLMTDGTITVESLSDNKLVMRLTGKAGKYEFQRIPTKWITVQGLIVIRNPSLRLQHVTRKDVFF